MGEGGDGIANAAVADYGKTAIQSTPPTPWATGSTVVVMVVVLNGVYTNVVRGENKRRTCACVSAFNNRRR